MSNPKKIDLAALLQDDDAPMNSPYCLELECGNLALPDDEYCPEHTDKQAVEAGRFPGPEKRSDRRGQPVEEGGRAITENGTCTRCKKRPYVYGSAQDGLCEVCASRVKAEAVLNPGRLVPKVVAGLRRCVYCSNIVDADQGLGITCYQHAEEKWREHDRKETRGMKLGKRQQAVLAKKKAQDEEAYKGTCRGCGKHVEGEYNCHDCRTKKQREALSLKDGEVELYRGHVGKPEDKLVKQVVVINAADGEIEDVDWIWLNKIPLGCATWILGQPGNAKSLMTIAITACVTTGKDFPDGSKNTVPPSKVLMYSGEDSLSKIVRPRLLAAGADLTKVMFLNRKSFRTVAGDNDPEKRPLDLSQDCDVLLDLVKQHPDIKLLIVDPITGVFGNKNINKNEEANPVFEKLIDFCEASGIAFVGVLHVPKRTTNSSIEKIAGGTAVAGSAKSAFMLSRDLDSEDKHEHVLTMVKWNYASNMDGIKYKTVPATASWKGKQTSTVVIEWGEVITEIADDVLAKQNSKDAERDRQADRCAGFLRTYLTKGPQRSREVYESAKAAGFGKSTVQRALEELGGDHLDRRAQGQGYWMTLTPGVDAAPQPELLMSVTAGEAL